MKFFSVLLIVTSASAIATSRARSPRLKGQSNLRYGSGMGASNRRDVEDVEALDPRHERNAAAIGIGMVNRRDEM
ncbi:hypothetical protein CFIMG_005755RAa [Ceratocystis fimbriata CBS 114723]|uniref:Uncharacterized protein n=1 Tax=Ceratocystis fimbriata CBS 114723 TaxID=1035309 RepID=A0A2C5X1L5_9PEZI|nr:hypothetical protein CFIMG_005755RAa [Ceratocystis fimbriata CBS 114723]